MRRSSIHGVLICAVVAGAGVSLLGQRGGQPAAAPPPPQRFQIVVIGCLKEVPAAAGKPAEMTITDYRGGEMATVRLDATDSKLIPWPNHVMEVHGTIAEPINAVAKVPAKLKVTEVYEIARRCMP